METEVSNNNIKNSAEQKELTPDIELTMDISRQLPSWLAEQQVSLAITTYQTNRLFLIGLKPDQQLSIFQRIFPRAMAVCRNAQSLYLSSVSQIWRLENCLQPGQKQDEYDCLYIPQAAYTTGDIDVHDIAVNQKNQVIFVNTLFSCLASISESHSFKPVWKPPFITKLAAEDRCHLNGLAIRDGQARYVTMLAQTDVYQGWRDHRSNGGIVMDIISNEIIARGLSMPHSPRWYQDKLYLLNSGTGEFGYINLASGAFEPIAFCAGYARGLSFVGNFAIIGLSRARDKNFAGLALSDKLSAKQTKDRCGLQIINLTTGDIVHSLSFEGDVISEIYDLAVLEQIQCPAAIGIANDQIRRLISIEESAENTL